MGPPAAWAAPGAKDYQHRGQGYVVSRSRSRSVQFSKGCKNGNNFSKRRRRQWCITRTLLSVIQTKYFTNKKTTTKNKKGPMYAWPKNNNNKKTHQKTKKIPDENCTLFILHAHLLKTFQWPSMVIHDSVGNYVSELIVVYIYQQVSYLHKNPAVDIRWPRVFFLLVVLHNWAYLLPGCTC